MTKVKAAHNSIRVGPTILFDGLTPTTSTGLDLFLTLLPFVSSRVVSAGPSPLEIPDGWESDTNVFTELGLQVFLARVKPSSKGRSGLRLVLIGHCE